MVALNLGFNGSSATFDSEAIDNILSISPDESCKEVDVSAADEDETIEPGQGKTICSIEVVGSSSLTLKAKGELAITWKDGTTTSIANACLVGKSKKGSKNNPISTTLKFAKSTDAA